MRTTLEKVGKTAVPERRLSLTRMEEMMRDVERFWERSFPFRFDLVRRDPNLALPEFDWSPRVDLWQEGGELRLRADLPGLKKEDVEIFLEEGELVLKGERKEVKEHKEADLYRSECTFGSFYRRIPLGFELDPKLIKAQMKDGVLELHIPMPPKVRPEPLRIPIA